MCKWVFARQQPKAKEFRKYCCDTMFAHVRQQMTEKMEEIIKKLSQRSKEDISLPDSERP